MGEGGYQDHRVPSPFPSSPSFLPSFHPRGGLWTRVELGVIFLYFTSQSLYSHGCAWAEANGQGFPGT